MLEAKTLPSAKITFAAWAIDLPRQRAFPIAGALEVSPP